MRGVPLPLIKWIVLPEHFEFASLGFKYIEFMNKNAATGDIKQLHHIVEYGQQFTYLWGKVVFQFGICLPLHIIFTMMIVSSPTTTYLQQQQQQHTYNNNNILTITTTYLQQQQHTHSNNNILTTTTY